jgi:hypothetical protein
MTLYGEVENIVMEMALAYFKSRWYHSPEQIKEIAENVSQDILYFDQGSNPVLPESKPDTFLSIKGKVL